MKRQHILLAIAATSMVAACQPKEEFSSVPARDVTITATFEQTDDGTRTSLNSTGGVLWSAGDELAVMTPSTKDKFTLASGANAATAGFSGTMTGSAPFYLLYPYSDGCTVADGKLKFSLPQVQTVPKAGTFGQGASPAVAVMNDDSSPAQFKNLCGVLEINLCGSGIMVDSIAVSDIAGAPLWGDCEVALDGTQGTDEQKMTVTGGSSTVILKLDKKISLKTSSATLFEVVVPAGSFSKGFSVKIFDSTNGQIGIFSSMNTAAVIHRSKISPMNKFKLTDEYIESSDPAYRGYYKELLVDRGRGLSGVLNPPAADTLGWSHDYFGAKDDNLTQQIFGGQPDDLNGVLLYPDGEPRYRMIYVNGGSAETHGKSLGTVGRKAIKSFYYAGGSYAGTCAGAYITSMGNGSPNTNYLGIYPSYVGGMSFLDTCTNLTIPENSPLLKYYDYGGDLRIDSVYFNGGCNLPEANLVEGAEVLARFNLVRTPTDRPGYNFEQHHNKINCWAYKQSEETGRMVVTGAHPEGEATGEKLHMFIAMYRYATEGNGKISEKAVLVKGEERVMDQQSSANKPENACIGDRQYHHFKLEIPAGGAKNFTLKLKAANGKNLMLSLRKGDFAWRSESDYMLACPGSDKTLSINNLPEGTWYVGVFGTDAPKTSCSETSFSFIGDKTLLNGVPYSIVANWD